MRQSTHRTLSPYEQTHLARHGVPFDDPAAFFAKYGEMPVEYITGHVTFCDLDFHVSPDVLIPRVETEELVALVVEAAVARAAAGATKVKIADVGTGSGAIAISVCHALLQRRIMVDIYASDISATALGVARQNATRLLENNTDRVHFLHSDLLDEYPSTMKFDIVVANLPYIPTDRIASLDASVTSFEPHLALDGGADGLKQIRRLLQSAAAHLTSNGETYLEIDYIHDQSSWQEFAPQWNVQLVMDQFEKTRFAVARRK